MSADDHTKPDEENYHSFKEWKTGLSEQQMEWLRHKCRWEGMTQMAVAFEWGVPVNPEEYM